MIVEMSVFPVIYIVPILVSHFIYVKVLSQSSFLSDVLCLRYVFLYQMSLLHNRWLSVVNGRTMGIV